MKFRNTKKNRVSRKKTRKQKGGALSLTKDGITFTLLAKTLGDPLILGSRDLVKLQSSRPETTEFYCYRSESEGMWRFACFDSEYKSQLYKGEDYITVTFIHIELQKFISENLHLVPDDSIELGSLPICKTYPTLSDAQTITTPNEFQELAKIKCGVHYEGFVNPRLGQETGLVSYIEKLREEAVDKKNDLLTSIIDKNLPALKALNKYKPVWLRYRNRRIKAEEEGEEEEPDIIKNDYHIVATDALQSFYGILSEYVEKIMTVKSDSLKFLFSFRDELFTNITYLKKDILKETPLREHADLLFNIYTVDVRIGEIEYDLICAKYKYNYEDQRARPPVSGTNEFTCIMNLVPKVNEITMYGTYKNVISIGNYICKIMEYDLHTLMDLEHLLRSEKNVPMDKHYRPTLPLRIGNYWFVGNYISGMFPLNSLPFGPFMEP